MMLQAVIIVATCGGYLWASSALILLNKFLLSTDGFSFPLLLSGSGMVMTFFGSSVMVRVPALVPERQVRAGPGACCPVVAASARACARSGVCACVGLQCL